MFRNRLHIRLTSGIVVGENRKSCTFLLHMIFFCGTTKYSCAIYPPFIVALVETRVRNNMQSHDQRRQTR